jgi:hypothetical protein
MVFPRAGERRRHFSGVFPGSATGRAHTPPMPIISALWLTFAFVLGSTTNRFPNKLGYLGRCGSVPILRLSPSTVGPPSAQRSFAPGACCCFPSSLVRPQLPVSAPLPDFPFFGYTESLAIRMSIDWLRDLLPFTADPFPTCHTLRLRGARRVHLPSSSRGLQPSPLQDRLGAANPPSALWWGTFGAQSHGPLICSPPVQIRPELASSAAGTLTPELSSNESPPSERPVSIQR